MDIDIKTWLYDILNAINEIESYFIDIPKDFFVYKNDLKTKRAVERNIEIIGEAMSRILSQENSYSVASHFLKILRFS